MTSHRATPRSPRNAAVFLVVLTSLGALVGVILGQARGPQWQASTDVLVRLWSAETLLITGQVGPVRAEDTADAAALAVSMDVLTSAAEQLDDGRTGAQLAADVTAVAQGASHIVTVQATATDSETATRTAQAVGAALVAVVQQRITATAATLPGGPPDQPLGDVQLRAQLLGGTVQPLQVLRTGDPEQTNPNAQTPIALGIVGLALGVLVLVALSFARPVISRPRDAQRLVGLPSALFTPSGESPETARMVRLLLDEHPDGDLLLCPVHDYAEKATLAFADWIRAQSRDDAEAARVVPVSEPSAAILGARRDAEVAAVLVIVPRGTRPAVLSNAVGLLASWRRADAVVITT